MANRRRDSLEDYRARRHFERTPEPKGAARPTGHRYLIQQHAARRLHYDFRLELDGVLKSWAVPKGPSLDPADKRLAVQTEDHPVDYATFEGRIPEGNYGAGTVLLWDEGAWEPVGDPHRGLEDGKLVFRLRGRRLKGEWALVRIGGTGRGKQNWLLIKERDNAAVRDGEVTAKHRTSVASGRDMDAIAAAPRAEWHSDDGIAGPAAKPPAKRRARAAHVSLPAFVEPALATLVDQVPGGENWLFEVKFDGYRALAAASGPQVRIDSRSGLDWTARYPAIVRTLAGLDLPGVLLDGEMVVVDDQGRSDFGALQQALKEGGEGIACFVFDLLAENGHSLRDRPLAERKARLKDLLGPAGRTGPVFYADHVARDGGTMLKTLCEAGFEGVIAKRADAPYRSGRGPSWLKVKCAHRQEFVIIGWSPSTRGRPFSSLLLALNEGGGLRYAGRVGAGFSTEQLDALARRFRPAERPQVTGPVPPSIARSAHWVRPELVAEIGFAEFTGDGLVRQGRFLGLRDDKEAASVVRETPAPVEASASPGADQAPLTLGQVHLTHPDKVLFPEQGITKRDLATYFQAVAERMLPFISGRLLTLLRCPEGSGGSCFVQRHSGQGVPASFRELEVAEAAGKTRRYLYLEDAEGLFAAAQMGVLELHIWGSRVDRVDQPDRIVFDLDPDPAVTFDTVKQAARRMRDVLEALGLQSFPLLTGGKGIHVVAPIQRRHDWPRVKSFTRAIAERLAADDPDRYVATMSKAKRTGRIFIDYLRNDHAATAVAPYSTRRHSGAPLAWPVGWDELDGIAAANAVTIATAAGRLRGSDPWSEYHSLRQGLSAAALRALGL